MSLIGRSRRSAVSHKFGRDWRLAEIGRKATSPGKFKLLGRTTWCLAVDLNAPATRTYDRERYFEILSYAAASAIRR